MEALVGRRDLVSWSREIHLLGDEELRETWLNGVCVDASDARGYKSMWYTDRPIKIVKKQDDEPARRYVSPRLGHN